MHNNTNYDVIVIGAGIQGAGVAQACAACGYRTLVIERFPDAGMGTSSKSSKLIHGGLRYLESGQFSLVKECLDERKYLLKNAPQLVNLIPFYIPVYKHSQRPAWLIRLGLFIYSLLSFRFFSSINKKDWHKLEGLITRSLSHVFRYYDAQTNDTQLTRAVMRSAKQLGAQVLYNTEFINAEYIDDLHHVHCRSDSTEQSFNSRCIINCSGPWVSETQKKIFPLIDLPDIDLVAGSHIILDHTPHKNAFYIEAHDHRAVFVLPWEHDTTLVGTTERIYRGRPEDLEITEEEIDYLLNTYNEHFSPSSSRNDVQSHFSGLRVLPADNADAFHRSRDSLIVQSPVCPSVITLIGGKLTAYRSSANAILRKVKKILPPEKQGCDTRKIQLPVSDQP